MIGKSKTGLRPLQQCDRERIKIAMQQRYDISVCTVVLSFNMVFTSHNKEDNYSFHDDINEWF